MVETVISIRTARLGDEDEIASVHDAAWREAYRGVIPGRELELSLDATQIKLFDPDGGRALG